MFIHTLDFSAKYKSLDIYIQGCSGVPKCSGCHNPELWEFLNEDNVAESLDNIADYINGYPSLIDKIFIYGGEPLDQDRAVFLFFLEKLKEFGLKIYLFTRYSLDEIDQSVKDLCDYIKCGRYDLEKVGQISFYGITLNSTNQVIYKKGIDF